MIPKNLIWCGWPDSNWSSLAWKAKVQPLYHTRKLFGTQGEIRTLPFGFGIQRATKPYYLLVRVVGLEPTASCVQGRPSTN